MLEKTVEPPPTTATNRDAFESPVGRAIVEGRDFVVSAKALASWLHQQPKNAVMRHLSKDEEGKDYRYVAKEEAVLLAERNGESVEAIKSLKKNKRGDSACFCMLSASCARRLAMRGSGELAKQARAYFAREIGFMTT